MFQTKNSELAGNQIILWPPYIFCMILYYVKKDSTVTYTVFLLFVIHWKIKVSVSWQKWLDKRLLRYQFLKVTVCSVINNVSCNCSEELYMTSQIINFKKSISKTARPIVHKIFLFSMLFISTLHRKFFEDTYPLNSFIGCW